MAVSVYPCIQWPGSKVRMADEIINLLGPHDSYVEPYFGSGAVLLNKPRSKSEIVNDLNDDVVNFYAVLRDRPTELIEACELSPCSEAEFIAARPDPDLPELERARRFFVRSCQGHGGPRGGWIASTTAQNNLGQKWVRRLGRLYPVAQRLQGVQITKRDALEVFARVVDDPAVATYLDPPYLADTLSFTGHYESLDGMSVEHHTEMLRLACAARGTVVISGYSHPMYDEALAGWHRHDVGQEHLGSPKAMEGKGKKVEVLWVNHKEAHLF